MADTTTPAVTPEQTATAVPSPAPVAPVETPLAPVVPAAPVTPEPAAEPAPTPEAAPAAPANPEGFKPLEELSDAEILAITSDPAQNAAYQKFLVGETPAAPAPAADAPVVDPVAPVDPDAEADVAEVEALKRLRVGFLPEGDRRKLNSAIQLARAESISLEEAIGRIFKSAAPAPAAPAPAPATPEPAAPATPEPPANPTAEIDTRIADIRAKLKKAKADFDYDAEDDLLDKLTDAKSERQMALFRAEQTQIALANEAESAFETDYRTVVAEAHEMFPAGADPQSEFAREVAREITRLDQAKSSILDDPNYPLVIALRVGRKLNIAPTSPSAPAAPAAPAVIPAAELPSPVPAARPARPVPPAVGPTAPPSTMDAKTAWAEIDKITDPDELAKVAAALG